LCSLEPLGRYSSETIILTLPGETTIFDIDWISVWDEETSENYGHVNIPEGLNIPPSLAVIRVRIRWNTLFQTPFLYILGTLESC
jgi:hypothetical protein